MALHNETYFEFAELENPYTVVDNSICNDTKIEYLAQGLYLQIMRYRNSGKHKLYMGGLVNTKGSITDVRRALFNLQMQGFITREQLKSTDGKFTGMKYVVYGRPIEVSLDKKLEIAKESKINLDFAVEMYQELWPNLRDFYINSFSSNSESKVVKFNNKVKKLDEINGFTEISPTDNGPTHIGSTDTKKENGLKKKNVKKENNSLLAGSNERVTNPVSDLIEKETTLQLTPNQVKTVAKWDITKAKVAVKLFINHGGMVFHYLTKCYNNPIQVIKVRKSTFNNFEGNLDLAEVERIAEERFNASLEALRKQETPQEQQETPQEQPVTIDLGPKVDLNVLFEEIDDMFK